MRKAILEHPEDTATREEFKEIAKLVIKYNSNIDESTQSVRMELWRRGPFPDKALSAMSQLLFEVGDFDSFEAMIRLHEGEISSALFPCIGKVLSLRGFTAFQATYVSRCRPSPFAYTIKRCNRINCLFLPCSLDNVYSKAEPTIESRSDVVTSLIAACLSEIGEDEPQNQQDRQELEKWGRGRAEGLLTSAYQARSVSTEDGPGLAFVVQRYSDETVQRMCVKQAIEAPS